MVDETLLPFWTVAHGARRGPDSQHWVGVLADRCIEETDPRLQKLYLKLEEELRNEQRSEDAA